MTTIEGVLANQDRWHVECCDVRAGLARLPDGCVHTIITSPPYWGLRNYQIPAGVWGGDPGCQHEWGRQETGSYQPVDRRRPNKRIKSARAQSSDAGQFCTKCSAWHGTFGNEPTLELYIAHTLDILRECYRVLRDDGTLWWNIGDAFTRDDKYGGQTGGNHGHYLPMEQRMRAKRKSGQKNLSKLMIPHRVALAASQAGWIVRQDVVWHKLSPMPESVQASRWVICQHPTGQRDEDERPIMRPCEGCSRCIDFEGRRVRLQLGAWRPTTAHEFIFQMVKGEGYFGDAEAVKEPTSGGAHSRGKGRSPKGESVDAKNRGRDTPKQHSQFHRDVSGEVTHRNPRSFWSLSTEPLKEKHFAAFPSFLPRRCILASTSGLGVCPVCGANYAPVIERERVPTRHGKRSKVNGIVLDPDSPYLKDAIAGNRDPRRHQTETRAIGWLPTCSCRAVPIPAAPAIVLDIFSGSGTTGRVAYHLGRRFIGFEIAERYAELSRERIVTPFPTKQRAPKHKRPMDGQKSLFE